MSLHFLSAGGLPALPHTMARTMGSQVYRSGDLRHREAPWAGPSSASSARGTSPRAVAVAVAVLLGIVGTSAVASADPSDLPPTVGFDYGEIQTPRIAAMSGALRAMSNSTSALFLNPGNMASTHVYHVAGFASLWPQANRQSYGAAAVDSIVSSTGLAGGVGGTWNQQDPDGVERQYTDLRFGLAMPFANTLFVGLAGRMLSLTQDGEGPLRRSVAQGLRDENIVNAFTFDAGATLKPIPEIGIAVSGQNLTNADNGFQPMTVGTGLGFGNEDFTLEGDVVFDFSTFEDTTLRYLGGFEGLFADSVAVRAGYEHDSGNDLNWVSGGLGYLDPRFAVNAAVRQTVSGEGATAVTFGFTLHIEATGLTPGPSASF